MSEEWRPVVGYEGLYEVSNIGNVRSLGRWSRNRQSEFFREGGDLTLHVLRHGHLCVYLYSLGAKNHKRHLVHRLVLTAFVGPCPDGHEGCHIDGNPPNNKVENLYWGTRKQNMEDARRHGTAGYFRVAQRTHCRNGHEYTPENTRIYKSKTGTFRSCVACKRRRTPQPQREERESA